jgi:hypothetical protein
MAQTQEIVTRFATFSHTIDVAAALRNGYNADLKEARYRSLWPCYSIKTGYRCK